MLPLEEINVALEISGIQHTANNLRNTKYKNTTAILYPTVDYQDYRIEILTTNTCVTFKFMKKRKKAEGSAFFVLLLRIQVMIAYVFVHVIIYF